MVAQRLAMVRIEPQHALERVQRIVFAGEVDEDLSERDQRRKVVDVATDERDDAR